MKRRAVLTTGAGIALAALAGCLEGNGAGDEDDTTTTGDGPTTAPAAETTDGDSEAVSYGSLYAYDNDYVVEMDFDDPDTGQSGSGTVRYHGDDYHMRFEVDDTGDVFEIYHVEDDDYVVLSGEVCYRNPGPAMTPDADVQSTADAETHGSKPDADLKPTGTTEIDGERVYIYEVTGADVDGTLTLYVSASTGYLRRVEGDWGTATYHSWGETDPITKPDLNCQEVGG